MKQVLDQLRPRSRARFDDLHPLLVSTFPRCRDCLHSTIVLRGSRDSCESSARNSCLDRSALSTHMRDARSHGATCVPPLDARAYQPRLCKMLSHRSTSPHSEQGRSESSTQRKERLADPLKIDRTTREQFNTRMRGRCRF
jgi:hypothetical protein